jgi:hypothetical protein
MPCQQRQLVDWFSFSALTDEPLDAETLPDTIIRARRAAKEVIELLPEIAPSLADVQRGRKPYRYACGEPYMRMLFSEGQPHVTVELTGQGCELARERNVLDDLIALGHRRATRIDLTVDYLTDMKPERFIEAGHNGRFVAGKHDWSATGDTWYVGSEKSDRYARVYRYFPPHPRSNLLRVEMVMRAEHARQYSQICHLNGTERAVEAAGRVFAWQHPLWSSDNAPKRKTWRTETKQGGTVRWFFNQVVPAVRRMMGDGTLTHREVLAALELTPLYVSSIDWSEDDDQ